MPYIQERTTRGGKKHFRVQVRLRGYPTQSATFERKTDATKWAQATEARIREGRHFHYAEAKRHTLGDLVDRYIKGLSIKTSADRKRHLAWWKKRLGDYTLSDVTPARIAEYRDELLQGKTARGEQRAPATVVRYLASLSHAFTIAVKEWGWVESNPVLKVTKPKEPRGRVRFLEEEERRRLLEACQSSPNAYLYPAVVLAISTGMRLGEVMGLRWDDVDLKQGRITLHETKNGERRVVPLAGHALDVLKAHAKAQRHDSALMFPGKPRRRRKRVVTEKAAERPMDLRAPWTRALKTAGVEDFRFHDLRHSAASYLAMNGASLAEIAEVLGHKTLQMVKRYAHLSEAHTAKVVASMNEKIFG